MLLVRNDIQREPSRVVPGRIEIDGQLRVAITTGCLLEAEVHEVGESICLRFSLVRDQGQRDPGS